MYNQTFTSIEACEKLCRSRQYFMAGGLEKCLANCKKLIPMPMVKEAEIPKEEKINYLSYIAVGLAGIALIVYLAKR